MKVLVTGSTGHLGEALMRMLPGAGHDAVGLDISAGALTGHVGSITDRDCVRRAMEGCASVVHTATLHKPHVATHPKQDFIDTNISGTLTLLEEAARAGIGRFVFTSTTSAFGAALTPAPGAPAVWIDETVVPVTKNIYGVTKTAAEDLCALFAREHGMGCVVLRTSRFFPEMDDTKATREAFGDTNVKANEFLFRRVDIEDAASAHVCALGRPAGAGFASYVISAPSPFGRGDLSELRTDPAGVVSRYYPEFADIYRKAGFAMFAEIGRIYASGRAQVELGWVPRHDFGSVLRQIAAGARFGSELTRTVGSKGYHAESFADGPYPVEREAAPVRG